jgi:hypothetical protein
MYVNQQSSFDISGHYLRNISIIITINSYHFSPKYFVSAQYLFELYEGKIVPNILKLNHGAGIAQSV